jgi:hypothetical protein
MPVYPGAPTGRPVPARRIGSLPLTVLTACGLPSRRPGPLHPVERPDSYRSDWFSCSVPAPGTSSRHLHTGHRQGNKKAASRLRARPLERASVPGVRSTPGFGAIVPSVNASAVVHTRSSSRCTPTDSGSFAATLTTPALDRRGLRWFRLPACTANPKGQPSPLAQHGLCWRPSTSPHSPFRTHPRSTGTRPALSSIPSATPGRQISASDVSSAVPPGRCRVGERLEAPDHLHVAGLAPECDRDEAPRPCHPTGLD